MSRPFSILLVDDDPNDVLLLKRALRHAGFSAPVHDVSDGMKAVEYLKSALEKGRGLDLPALVILDMNMPLMTGSEVLAWIRSEPRFTNLPVVILSQLDQSADINRAHHLGANSYLVKTSNFQSLVGMMDMLKGLINPA